MEENKELGLRGWLSGGKTKKDSEGTIEKPIILDKHRLAVLPFANVSPDKGDEYLAEGMTDELISTISSVAGFTVIARTSAMSYKGTNKKVNEIGTELDVGTVLDGSVRKAGSKLRVTVQLIDVASQGNLWGQSYDRDFQDIFAIQSEIARNVADALRIKMLPNVARYLEKTPTLSTEAHTLYLKGRYYWNERTRGSLAKAIRYFESAIAQDTNYARAYAGLADCYRILENWGYLGPSETHPKIKEYVTKAISIDETLAESHSIIAFSLATEWDWKGAEREFRRAIDLDPNYATAHQGYAYAVCMPWERWDEGLVELRLAQSLDPLSPAISLNIAEFILRSGRVEDALVQYQRVIEINPDFAYSHGRLGVALVRAGRFREGVAEVEKAVSLSNRISLLLPDLIYAYFSSGRVDEAERIFDELTEASKRKTISSMDYAYACACLGKKDLAFEHLNKAVDEHSNQIASNLSSFELDNVRPDPRFQDLKKRMGLK